MRKLIKEQCRVEGKKSQVGRADTMEHDKVMATIFAAGHLTQNYDYAIEFEKYCEKIFKKAVKKFEKKPNMTYQELLDYLLK